MLMTTTTYVSWKENISTAQSEILCRLFVYLAWVTLHDTAEFPCMLTTRMAYRLSRNVLPGYLCCIFKNTLHKQFCFAPGQSNVDSKLLPSHEKAVQPWYTKFWEVQRLLTFTFIQQPKITPVQPEIPFHTWEAPRSVLSPYAGHPEWGLLLPTPSRQMQTTDYNSSFHANLNL